MDKQQPVQPTTHPSQAAQPVKPADEKIHVTIRNRTRVLLDADVKSVTSKNDTGIFDVLPEHSNFISLIASPLIIGLLDGKKQEISFKRGLLKVKDNKIHCYVDLLTQETNTAPAPLPVQVQANPKI